MSTADYREFRKDLPKRIFKPYPWRLLTMFSLWAVAIACLYGIVALDLPWYANFSLGLIVGHCWGVTGLVSHEILHGSVIRNCFWQEVFGFLCFTPFLVSPTFWRYWHNRLHHSHTQKSIIDPDAYPTLRIYKHSRFIKWMYPFTPGSGYKRSYLYFFFWFSFNVQVAQYYFRFRNKAFDSLNHRRVNYEMAAQILIHTALLFWAGPQNWLWVYPIPFIIQNYIPFSYISTNHNLSPLTKINDPLENSLTVTNHPILEFFHINFGYHVEHHLFPTVNHVHHKLIHKKLKEKYPGKFQVMPKWKAIKALYKTARIYKRNTVLINPLTEEVYGTLGHPLEIKTETAIDITEVKLSPDPNLSV